MATTKRSPWKALGETVVLLAVAVGLAITLKATTVQAFYIPSGSMEPGLQINDRIVVEKASYWWGHPQRGDIVVFSDPGGWLGEDDTTPTNVVSRVLEKIGLYPSGGHLVKRVIGVGGDTIVCCDDQGRISVNGTALDEDDFIDPQQDCDGPMADCTSGWKAVVPKGKLFVMGDNRDESADSSFHLCHDDSEDTCDPSAAYVDEDLVVGRVIALVWPFSRFTIEHRPSVFDDVAAADAAS
ncbi:MAG: signal peptidase I [Nocardioides sp.]|uniref:signal peptidase I n=1 Tax=Nocardioides sp. TaxID=35761 RepID=UPI0039E31ED5